MGGKSADGCEETAKKCHCPQNAVLYPSCSKTSEGLMCVCKIFASREITCVSSYLTGLPSDRLQGICPHCEPFGTGLTFTKPDKDGDSQYLPCCGGNYEDD